MIFCSCEKPVKTNTSPVKTISPTREADYNMIKKLIDNMTIEEKVAQLIITGYNNVDEVVNANINFCGVILFKKNISTISKTKSDIDKLKSFKYHLFVSVDQEGGRVSRLPEESGSFEAALEIGNKNDKQYAYSFGKKTGIALSNIGFNLNFAPVFDIYSNSKNTVIADRAFGKTPDRVSEIANEVMNGLRDANIIPTAKHFPGHGDTSVDSHAGLPVVEKTLGELQEYEFIPFRNAIKNNVEMIMAGHIVIKEVDSKPTTLSYEMITNVLRKQLMYDGVVITDDIGMGAISKKYSVKEAAVLAISAGCDIVLCSQNIESGKKAYNALLDAYKSGELTEQRINESLVRILRLKVEYGII